MFYDGGHFIGGMHGLWWIVWVVLIAVLVYAVWGRPGRDRGKPRETPLEVLQRRLAQGEIDIEQYEQRKAVLERDATGR